MCLNKITRKYPDNTTERIGYKVLLTTKNEKEYISLFSNCRYDVIRDNNYWNKAFGSNVLQVHLGLDGWEDKPMYRCGFHVFKRKKDAELYAHILYVVNVFNLTNVGNCVIKKVVGRNINTTGFTDLYNNQPCIRAKTFVCRELKFVGR